VDSLFVWAETAYDNGASIVHVDYDPTLHYPVNLSIDWILTAVDDEYAVSVEGLVPLPDSSIRE
jgi:hypothetical protein